MPGDQAPPTDGFLTLERAFFASYIWQMPARHRVVALQLLHDANWRESDAWINGRRRKVPRGTAVVSYVSLSERCGVGVRVVRTAIRYLEESEFLTREPTRTCTLITIVNYDKYQKVRDRSAGVAPDEPTRLPTRSRHGADTQPTSSEQGNKETRREGECVEPTPAPAPKKKRRRKKARPLETATDDERRICALVLDRLTEAVGARFSVCKTHVEPILARLRSGATEDELRLVVWSKANEWADDAEMRRFLTPATLFRESNFAKYLPNALVEWGPRPGPSHIATHPEADAPANVLDLSSLLRREGE